MPPETHVPTRAPVQLAQRLIAAARPERLWYVRLADDRERKLTTAEIVDAYNECLINHQTHVWTDGMPEWQELQNVDPLVEALHAEAARAVQPATNQDSAMFSLATLVAERTTPVPEPERKDDSGLIDLRALTASAQPVSEAFPELPVGLFPLPEPAPTPAQPVAPPNHRPLIVGLMAAIAILGATLVFLIVRSSGAPPIGPTAPSASSPTEPIAAPQTPAPAESTPPQPAEIASAPPAASSVDQPMRPPASVWRPPPPPSSTTVVPPPPKDACRCRPEDLDCHMRCAVKR